MLDVLTASENINDMDDIIGPRPLYRGGRLVFRGEYVTWPVQHVQAGAASALYFKCDHVISHLLARDGQGASQQAREQTECLRRRVHALEAIPLQILPARPELPVCSAR